MPRNLELKARCASLRHAIAVAKGLGARDCGVLRQTDAYFRVRNGRLKLRSINGARHELISYRRPNRSGGRYSDYSVLKVEDGFRLQRMLDETLGALVTIRKRRRLFLYRNARIHIDSVSGLGNFIEFEVVVTKGKMQAERLFETLVAAFEIDLRKTVAGSYSDMLMHRRRG